MSSPPGAWPGSRRLCRRYLARHRRFRSPVDDTEALVAPSAKAVAAGIDARWAELTSSEPDVLRQLIARRTDREIAEARHLGLLPGLGLGQER